MFRQSMIRYLGINALKLALLLGSFGVRAHGILERATPSPGSTVRTAPREVSIRFTQRLEPAFSTIEVTDAAGERVDLGRPQVSANVMRISLRPVGAGTYQVKWRVLSVDTHTTEGSYSFHVSQWATLD